MSALDWILVSVVLISALAALAHGFFSEMFSLAGTIIGFLLAAWQYGRLAPWFEPYVKSSAVANAAAFLTIVVIVGILASVLAKLASWGMKQAGLRWVDRALGGAFGLVRGLALATVVVLIATAFTPEAGWLQRSRLAGYLALPARVVTWAAPASVRGKFLDGIAYLRKLRQDALAKADKTPAGNTGTIDNLDVKRKAAP